MAKQPQLPKETAPAGPEGKSTPAAGAKSTGAKGTAPKGSAKGRRNRKSGNRTLIWVIVGGVVLIFAGIIAINWQTLFGSASAVPATISEGTSWGPVSAPVKVVGYSNFGCSHCRNFAENGGLALRKLYETTGKVRFESKQFKLADPTTADAANAALCAADQNRYWDYHDLLFKQQGASASPFAKAALKQYGQDLGLDASKFGPCVDGNQHMNIVDQESADGVNQGVEGTPTFFVTKGNDTKQIVGDQPDQIKAMIEADLQG
jgi:protein-disulfide isomerase